MTKESRPPSIPAAIRWLRGINTKMTFVMPPAADRDACRRGSGTTGAARLCLYQTVTAKEADTERIDEREHKEETHRDFRDHRRLRSHVVADWRLANGDLFRVGRVPRGIAPVSSVRPLLRRQ